MQRALPHAQPTRALNATERAARRTSAERRAQAAIAMSDAERQRLEAAWLATAWPDRSVTMGNRLNRLHLARVARDKDQPLYLWYGPAVPRRAVVRQSALR
jgi:hypothetical protein